MRLRTKTQFAPAIRAAHPHIGRGRGRGIDPDRNLCADRDRLSAAGDAGGDFQAGGTGDQPRRHRRPQAPRPDRRAIRAPQPGAPFAYVTTKKFLEAFGFASLRDLPDLERLKADGLLEKGGGRLILIAPSVWRSRATRIGTCLNRGGGKTSAPARICKRGVS